MTSYTLTLRAPDNSIKNASIQAPDDARMLHVVEIAKAAFPNDKIVIVE